MGPALEPELLEALIAVEGGAGTCDAVAIQLGLDGNAAAVTPRPPRADGLRGGRRRRALLADAAQPAVTLTRDVVRAPRPDRDLDRRVGLGRRSGDPGRSQGVRPLRRPRDDRDHCADRSEHRRRRGGRADAARDDRRAGPRRRLGHRHRRGEDRHARRRGDDRRRGRVARRDREVPPRGADRARPRDGRRERRDACSTPTRRSR